jgi:hypothetical protein
MAERARALSGTVSAAPAGGGRFWPLVEVPTSAEVPTKLSLGRASQLK